MISSTRAIRGLALLAMLVLVAALSGCSQYQQLVHSFYRTPPPPEPLGTKSDLCWRQQEANAEASDFVVCQHEFELNGRRLNTAGEDHVKQIAARLLAGQDLPVVIERGTMSPRPDTEYKFPVHPNTELDLERREVVARALGAMGVDDADQRVVAAPAYSAGMKATEAERAYLRGFQQGLGGQGAGFGGGTFTPFTSGAVR